MKIEAVIDRLDWGSIETQLDQEGYVVLPGLLDRSHVKDLAALVVDLRASFYKHLAPIANRWNDAMGVSHHYPPTLEAFAARNGQAGQVRSQSNLSRLREGDYQALHQRSDGEHVFPLQLVALLSEPGKDFTGGEFVMTEQRPRMQSRAMVLPLGRGDMAAITVAQRPHRGTKGYYSVNMKHAISRIRSGERVGLEIVLHDTRQG